MWIIVSSFPSFFLYVIGRLLPVLFSYASLDVNLQDYFSDKVIYFGTFHQSTIAQVVVNIMGLVLSVLDLFLLLSLALLGPVELEWRGFSCIQNIWMPVYFQRFFCFGSGSIVLETLLFSANPCSFTHFFENYFCNCFQRAKYQVFFYSLWKLEPSVCFLVLLSYDVFEEF